MRRAVRNLKKDGSLSYLQKNVVSTTLYELIETISEEVQPEEKSLIPEIVINLLRTYRSSCWVQ